MTELVQRIAVKAIIVDGKNRILLLRKSDDNVRHAGRSGRYNLPGGKVNPGEKIEDALMREIMEEVKLVLRTKAQKPFFIDEWRPMVKNVPHQIIGIFYICSDWQGEVKLDSEHDKYTWVDSQSLARYDILPPEDQAITEYFNSTIGSVDVL